MMVTISVNEATKGFLGLIEKVEAGDEVLLTRRGKAVAKLVPPPCQTPVLSSLKQFRDSLQVEGESLSTTVLRAREEERC